MGKPVDSVLLEAVERASGILESNIEFLEDDIEGLTEFQDRVSDMELGSNGSSNSTYIGGSSNTSDTGKVVGWFEELVYSRQDDSEFVEEKAERFDLSEPSAHFLQELLSISNIDDGDVLANIRYLDSGNAMGPSHVQEVISLAEYPKASRKEVVDDIEIARNSLENYRHELSNLDNHITELNEDYILPMSLDDAVTVVRYFDVIEDRLDQLESRREHELRRMPDIIDDYSLKTVETYFEPEEFEDPVLYEIENMRESIYEARENIALN